MTTNTFTSLLLFLCASSLVAAHVCIWQGTPPFCSDECPLQYPNKLAIGKGGCNNGGLCEQGHKALCCPPSFRPPNCAWYGTGPFCNGHCPPGKVEIAESDSGGDGSLCITGCKVFCCDAIQTSSLENPLATPSIALDDEISRPSVGIEAKAGYGLFDNAHKEL